MNQCHLTLPIKKLENQKEVKTNNNLFKNLSKKKKRKLRRNLNQKQKPKF